MRVSVRKFVNFKRRDDRVRVEDDMFAESLTLAPAEVLTTQCCVVSYNTRGFSIGKQLFCYEIFLNLCGNKVTILCVQKHFPLRSRAAWTRTIGFGFESICKIKSKSKSKSKV